MKGESDSGVITLVQAARKWTSPRLGPIRSIWCSSLGIPDPKWWIYGAELSRAPIGAYWSAANFGSAGASINREEAFLRAVGEAFERHASMNSVSEEDATYAPFSDSPLAERFARCESWERCPPMFKGLGREAPIRQSKVCSVATGEVVYVPSPYVHMGYTAPDKASLATYPISTGIAFSRDRVDALWRALCEVAERDAIMLFWLAHSTPRVLTTNPEEMPYSLSRRLTRLANVELETFLLDITTDFDVPTVLAVIRGHNYPYTTVGASCHVDAAKACEKALDEAVSVRFCLKSDKWSGVTPDFQEFSWVTRLEHHMVLYGAWRDSPALEFLQTGFPLSFNEFTSKYQNRVPQTYQEFELLCRRLLDERGLTVLARDLECSDTEPLGHTVRVIVPEMIPLSQDHNARWLATDRLRRNIQEAVNDYPHPFA